MKEQTAALDECRAADIYDAASSDACSDGRAPVAATGDVAVARVRKTLGHAADKLVAALESEIISGEDAFDLARAIAAVGRVRQRLADGEHGSSRRRSTTDDVDRRERGDMQRHARCRLPHPPDRTCPACGWDGICSSCDGQGCSTCREEEHLPPWHDLAGGDGAPSASDDVCSACRSIPEPGERFPEHTCASEERLLDAAQKEAWAKVDELKERRRKIGKRRAVIDLEYNDVHRAELIAELTARDMGPRPAKVPT